MEASEEDVVELLRSWVLSICCAPGRVLEGGMRVLRSLQVWMLTAAGLSTSMTGCHSLVCLGHCRQKHLVDFEARSSRAAQSSPSRGCT